MAGEYSPKRMRPGQCKGEDGTLKSKPSKICAKKEYKREEKEGGTLPGRSTVDSLVKVVERLVSLANAGRFATYGGPYVPPRLENSLAHHSCS